MIYFFFVAFLSFYLRSVHGFFYQALPLVVVKSNNNTYRAYCPWNFSTDFNMACKVNKNVMGYYHKSHTPKPNQFLNPLVQNLFTRDHCKHFKDTYNTSKTNVSFCKDYSQCFNLSDEHSLCTCDAGFFGDAYVGCKKHCYSNDECVSPVSYCNKPTNNKLPRCECKPGYQGDGVMCYKNPCGEDRYEKCGPDRQKVCVPTGPNEGDFKCMCPDGQFLDYTSKCVPEVTLEKDTVFTLVVKNLENGSRVEVGDCLSFTVNDGNKSMFFHKNSGDSVYVKRPVLNEGSFTVFFVLTDEVTAFSRLKGTPMGLSKLYSMSNTFKNCKFGYVKVVKPNGEEVLVGEHSTEKVEVKVRSLSTEEMVGGLPTSVKLPEKVVENEESVSELGAVSTLEL